MGEVEGDGATARRSQALLEGQSPTCYGLPVPGGGAQNHLGGHCAVVNQRPEDDSGRKVPTSPSSGSVETRAGRRGCSSWTTAESAWRLQDGGGGGARLSLVMEQARGGKLEARSRAVSLEQCRG